MNRTTVVSWLPHTWREGANEVVARQTGTCSTLTLEKNVWHAAVTKGIPHGAASYGVLLQRYVMLDCVSKPCSDTPWCNASMSARLTNALYFTKVLRSCVCGGLRLYCLRIQQGVCGTTSCSSSGPPRWVGQSLERPFPATSLATRDKARVTVPYVLAFPSAAYRLHTSFALVFRVVVLWWSVAAPLC